MNLFIRYFNHEALAHDVNEALNFLRSIGEIKVDGNTANRINDFYRSNNTYPFRLKVSYNNYVLFLKTDAETIDEFHRLEQENKAVRNDGRNMSNADKKRMQMEALSAVRPGWYEGSIVFKRVLVNAVTNKCSYIDTPFVVRCKAESPADCYNRIIDHLKSRTDLDPRCQFPSVRSNNFSYKFVKEA